MSAWQAAGAILSSMAVLFLLLRDFSRTRTARQGEGERLFGLLAAALDEARMVPQAVAGSHCLKARFEGQPVEIRTITDTLALRKLPSLWLMITLPETTGLSARLDLMMRPAAQSSFSKFDFLPDIIPLPAGFPEEAVAKSDDDAKAPSPEIFRPALPLFLTHRGKELLASPQGTRAVLQLAEANRARYGVFRQASFDLEPLRPELVLPLIRMVADMHRAATGRDTTVVSPAPIPERKVSLDA